MRRSLANTYLAKGSDLLRKSSLRGRVRNNVIGSSKLLNVLAFRRHRAAHFQYPEQSVRPGVGHDEVMDNRTRHVVNLISRLSSISYDNVWEDDSD